MQILDRIQEQLLGKPARKTAPEDMDILDKLEAEHDAVQALLAKLVKSEKSEERATLLRQIKAALVPHTRAEEKVVYDPILMLTEKGAEVDGQEGYLEHGLADSMLTKLSATRNKLSAKFTAAAKVLKELVDHHIQEEEHNLWPRVRNNFSPEERQQMNRDFEAAKKKLKLS